MTGYGIGGLGGGAPNKLLPWTNCSWKRCLSELQVCRDNVAMSFDFLGIENQQFFKTKGFSWIKSFLISGLMDLMKVWII